MTDFVAVIYDDEVAAMAAAHRQTTQAPLGPAYTRSQVIGNAWLRTTGAEVVIDSRADGATLVCSNSRSAAQLTAHVEPMASTALSTAPDSFAALWLNNDGSWSAATDRFASRPLYLATARDGGLWLATDLRSLRDAPEIDHALDEQALFNFVHFHVIPGPRTVFRDVSKVGAATRIDGRGGSTAASARYWPEATHDVSRDRKRLLTDIASGLHTAVERLASEAPNACFLSGGLDSSTIAGILARHGRTHAFTIGFDERGYDEMAYAELAAGHFGLEHHTVYIKPADVERLLPDIANRFGEPFGNLSAIPAFACATMARDAGFDTMFAGDGGDEFFAGNERYARHRLISHWRRLPRALRKPLEPLLVRLMGSRVSLLHKVGRYVDIAKNDLPVRLREDFEHFQGFAPEQIFSERFMAHIDRDNPMHVLRTIVDEAGGRDLLETLLQVDWQLTLTDNDLRKVHYACKAAGVTPVYPMLDADFVELSRSISSAEKLTATRLRAIFKDAFCDFLPERIINKPKHGFGLPFGEWLQSDPRLRELCDARLSSAVDRGLIEAPFVARLLEAHRDEHAAYFGTMIGALLMLEFWLERNASAAGWSA
ncbi:MAG: asparagine synthase-related protein [Pseudomonadota bacterium]